MSCPAVDEGLDQALRDAVVEAALEGKAMRQDLGEGAPRCFCERFSFLVLDHVVRG